MAKSGKRLAAATKGLDPKQSYALEAAIALVKKNATAKFDETIDLSINLNVDPRHADQMVRGMVQLPNGTGKTMRVAVFARGEKADAAKAAGAELVGAEDLAEAIQNGELGFDRCIATPDMMAVVGRLGKVLGHDVDTAHVQSNNAGNALGEENIFRVHHLGDVNGCATGTEVGR